VFAIVAVATFVSLQFVRRSAAPGGRIPIVVWGITFLGDDVYTLAARFERENPKYKIIISSGAERDINSDGQRLISTVAGGVPPDVVFFARHAIGEWASRRALLDLKPMIDAQRASDPSRLRLEEYYDWALDECRYRVPGSVGDRSLFGIPMTVDIRILIANRKMLIDAGEVDSKGDVVLPKTWEELAAATDRLKKFKSPGDPTSGIERLGLDPNFKLTGLYLSTFQAGGTLLNDDGSKVTFDTEPAVRALHHLADLYDRQGGYKTVESFQSAAQKGALDPFLAGQVAMKLENDFDFTFYTFFAPDLDIAVAPAPMPASELAAGRGPVTWGGGFALVIPSTAQQPEGAFKFIQYLTSWESTRLIEQGKRETAESEGRLYLPQGLANRVQYEQLIEQSITHNERMPKRIKDAYGVLRELMPRTLYRPVSPVGQLLWEQQLDALKAGLNHSFADKAKETGIDEMRLALRKAQLKAQARLDEVLAPPPPLVVHWWPWFVAYAGVIALPFVAMWIAYRRHRRSHAYKPREIGAAMLFLSPWLVLMIVFVAGPILFSVIISFTRYDVISPARYVGLQNFREILTDTLFYKSLGNTAYMLIRVPLMMAISLGIAMLLNRSIRGIGFYRTVFYMPAIVPLVASAFLWLWLLHPTVGPINAAISWFAGTLHLPIEAPKWFTDANWSKPGLIVMSLWSAGAGMIIWLAGLQSIPAQLYEAASIDGASKWRQFLHVTLPMLSPFILFNTIIGVIGTMQVFAESFIMTAGDPENSTLFYAYYLFKEAFQYFRFGYASALAWVLFVVVLILTLLQLWLSQRWVHYDRT
jgi:multiple sugar transport system permease protein